MFRFFLLFSVMLFFSSSYCSSVKKGKVQFIISNKETAIESEGLRFRGLRDSKPSPSPSPNINKLFSPEKPSEKFECYDLNEMWVTDQLIGKWENEAGAISIYKVKLPVPEGLIILLNKFVLKTDYEKWLGKNKDVTESVNLNEWMDFFSCGKLDGEPETFKTSLVLKILHYKTISDGRKHQDLYLVTDLRGPELRTYLFAYETEANTDLKQSIGAVQQSIQSIGFQTVRETEAKQMVTKTSKNKQQEYSEEYYADRQRILNNIKNLKGWWFLETANYVIISNLKDKKLISDMERNIEKARNAYKIILPVKKPINSVSVIKVFADRDEYLSYLGRNSDFAWSAGFWDHSKKELAVSPTEGNSRTQEGNKRLHEIMFHEAFHQYIYYAANGILTAPWFNEGCASFFEGLKIMPGKENNFDVDFSLHMENFLDMAKRKQISVEDFLNIKTYDVFYDKQLLEANYSMAWGLMYFLLKGSPVLKNKNAYAEIPSKYYDAIIETGDPDKATEAAWKGVDMKKFNSDFNSFWASQPMIIRSKGINPFEKNKKKSD
jgi:hypothetical protein